MALVAIASSCSHDEQPAPVIRTVAVKPTVPAEAKKPCAAPVSLPDRDLGEKETTNYWGRDRAALVECEARRGAAVASLE